MNTVSANTVSAPSVEVGPRIPRSPANHLSIADTHSLIKRDDQGKWDITVPRRELIFKDGELVFPIDLGLHDLSCKNRVLPSSASNGMPQDESAERHTSYDRLSPSPFALGQLCARLGIPAAYIRQCPLILQDQNVNFWLRQGSARTVGQKNGIDEGGGQPSGESKGSENWLLRARHGTLRAVLSERFSPLDNTTLLETLAPLLPPHYRAQWVSLEDESFHLRVIDPTRAHEVLPSDDFFVGVHLANSEVGYRSLTVDALVYRLVCTNGLVALVKGKSLLRQRHIHVAQPRFKAALEEALEQALGATETLLSQLQSATKQVVPDAGTAIERLSNHWHLSEATQELAKASLLGEPAIVQESAYGLLNAFTAAAQSLEGEKRYDLEMLASSLAQHGVPQFALATREEGTDAIKHLRNGASRDAEVGMNGGVR
jgi:hypothetical protein